MSWFTWFLVVDVAALVCALCGTLTEHWAPALASMVLAMLAGVLLCCDVRETCRQR